MSSAGVAGEVHVYDSFAHHPEEVSADLVAADSLFDSEARVFAVFQTPGQVRLDAFGAEFAKVLAGCSHVVVTGGPPQSWEGTLRELAEGVVHVGGSASVSLAGGEAVLEVAVRARPGDVVVLMKTGDLVGQGPLLRAMLAERALRDS